MGKYVFVQQGSCDLALVSNGLWMRCHWQRNDRPESPPSCFSKIRHYNGEWKDGLMDGYGVAK